MEAARVRMLATGYNGRVVQAGGQQWDSAPGAVHDVPALAASALEAEGWVRIGMCGVTRARPTFNLTIRDLYYDTQLASLLMWDGGEWRKINKES